MTARRSRLRIAIFATALGMVAAAALATTAGAATVAAGTVTYATVVFSPLPPSPGAFITLSCTWPDGTVQSHDLQNFGTGEYDGGLEGCTFAPILNVPAGYTASSVENCDGGTPVPGGGISETNFCAIAVTAPGVPDAEVALVGANFVPGPPEDDAYMTLTCTDSAGGVQTHNVTDADLSEFVGPCVFSITHVPAGYTASLSGCGDTAPDPGEVTETFICIIDVTKTTSAAFDQPIDGNGVINLVKSGRVVPIKATISGAAGPVTTGTVAVLANTVNCQSQDPSDSIEVYSTPGKSGGTNLMTYDPAAQRWRFNFDTSAFGLKVVGSCYKVDLRLGATDPDSDGKYTGGTVVGSFLIRLTK